MNAFLSRHNHDLNTAHRQKAIQAWHDCQSAEDAERAYAAGKEPSVVAFGWCCILALVVLVGAAAYVAIQGGN